jgi:hypothetical protein
MKKVINFLIFAFARVQHIFYLFIARLLNKEYQMVTPGASYAPWVLDKEFLAIYTKVKKNSLLNFLSGLGIMEVGGKCCFKRRKYFGSRRVARLQLYNDGLKAETNG